MAVVDTLIYDRVAADVDRVKTLKNKILTHGLSSLTTAENTEYFAGMKGAYNASDMNRVGNAVQEVADLAESAITDLYNFWSANNLPDLPQYYKMPYNATSIVVNPKTDWQISDVPTASDMSTYFANVSNLRSLVPMPAGTPAVPGSISSYATANDVERILYVTYQQIEAVEAARMANMTNTLGSYVYSGETLCGEF